MKACTYKTPAYLQDYLNPSVTSSQGLSPLAEQEVFNKTIALYSALLTRRCPFTGTNSNSTYSLELDNTEFEEDDYLALPVD